MDPFRLRDGTAITGTMLWYSALCEREVWLMSRGITPDPDGARLDAGRAIHELSYPRARKELEMEGMKVDVVDGRMIGEVKLSSRYLGAARLQLLYYLYRLRLRGVEARGELLVPLERRREEVVLDGESEAELMRAMRRIREIAGMERPPPPRWTHFCRRCAYRYYCWGSDM